MAFELFYLFGKNFSLEGKHSQLDTAKLSAGRKFLEETGPSKSIYLFGCQTGILAYDFYGAPLKNLISFLA